MTTAAEGHGLTVEVDDDMLVENAATATLFSPGMWVQRPTRTPLARREAALDIHCRGAAGEGREPLLPIPLPALAPPPDGAAADAGSGMAAAGLTPAGAGARASTAAAGSAGGPTPGSPGLAADPDLAYLSIADERERERAEREYLQQDSEHMAALEEAHARLREQNAAMEARLKSVTAAVGDVVDENQTIKSLLAMLRVRREDFVFNQQQTIGAQQEAIGARLLQNLEQDAAAMGPLPQQQHAQQQQQPAARHTAVPLHIQTQHTQHTQQQQLKQQQAHEQGSAERACSLVLAADAAALADMSPGCLLRISTPEMLRTVSPKVAAFRGTSDGLLGSAPGEAGQQELLVPPTAPPASPLDYPAEAQIAAAALTAKQGDTAAALLTLLDKALEGRVERQRLAATQQAQLAMLHSHVQQAQPAQQQPQMYSL